MNIFSANNKTVREHDISLYEYIKDNRQK